MSDTPPAIAVIPKNSRSDVRVCLDEYGGHQLIDLRVYEDFRAGPAGDVRGPTKKGISLRIETLPELIAGLEKARDEAVRRGLING